MISLKGECGDKLGVESVLAGARWGSLKMERAALSTGGQPFAAICCELIPRVFSSFLTPEDLDREVYVPHSVGHNKLIKVSSEVELSLTSSVESYRYNHIISNPTFSMALA